MNKLKLNIFMITLLLCMVCTVTKANNCYNQTFFHLLAGALGTDDDQRSYGMNAEAFSRVGRLFAESATITLNDIEILAGQKIDINQRDYFGATALHYAAMGDYLLFERLLKNGASPYIVDNGGWNVLHYAVAGGVMDGIWWDSASCINTSVDIANLVNQQDVNGDTPLHVAVYCSRTFSDKYSGKRELFIINALRDICVKWLLGHGADISMRNKAGYTPADCIKMDYDANDFYAKYLLNLIQPS